jgi:cytochrome c556
VKIYLSLLLVAVLMVATACSKAPPAEPELLKTATIKDIMDSMVDPSGDFLFESIVTIADEKGITEKAPQSDEEWKEVRRHAITLIEAPNLLVMPGRKVAQPSDKPENPDIELAPDQIQKLIDADRPRFIKHARGLQVAAAAALKAIDVRDTKALFEALDSVDKACENCHLEYWYPNDKQRSRGQDD